MKLLELKLEDLLQDGLITTTDLIDDYNNYLNSCELDRCVVDGDYLYELNMIIEKYPDYLYHNTLGYDIFDFDNPIIPALKKLSFDELIEFELWAYTLLDREYISSDKKRYVRYLLKFIDSGGLKK